MQANISEVSLLTRSFDVLRGELAAGAWERLQPAREQAPARLAGRTIWFVNSTARGGGVAEMIRTLLPYWRGSGIDARWLVVEAPPAFFRLTKRIHNLLHGIRDSRPGPRDRALFEQVTQTAAARCLKRISPGDVVILEDPQTAGLAPVLKRAGAIVVWRSHVGADHPSEPVEDAWRFLLPYVECADAFVFTRREYIPPGLDGQRAMLLAPAIDPLSAKNQSLPGPVAEAILNRCGLAQLTRRAEPTRVAVPGGRVVEVRRRCRVLREGAPPRLDADRLVVALARWDRLKDPIGIMHAFAEHVDDAGARLIVAGPATEAVADDPEGRGALREARAAWQRLPRARRGRIDLVALPMADLDENALMVNALQHGAAVVVKKSLQEGFGLGVTEGLWKARPVVATRVGGHQDQIEHGRTGLLVDDPSNLAAFGSAVSDLLRHSVDATRMAVAGREHVRSCSLADRYFVEWMRVLAGVLSQGASTVRDGPLALSAGQPLSGTP